MVECPSICNHGRTPNHKGGLGITGKMYWVFTFASLCVCVVGGGGGHFCAKIARITEVQGKIRVAKIQQCKVKQQRFYQLFISASSRDLLVENQSSRYSDTSPSVEGGGVHGYK